MARRKNSFKINTGKWGKPTSIRIGQRGKGNINISKRGVKYNPGCGIVILLGVTAVLGTVSFGLSIIPA